MPALTTTFDSSIVVIQDTSSQVNFSIADGDSTFTIETSSIMIKCEKFPFRIEFYNLQMVNLILKEPSAGGFSYYETARTVNFQSKPASTSMVQASAE